MTATSSSSRFENRSEIVASGYSSLSRSTTSRACSAGDSSAVPIRVRVVALISGCRLSEEGSCQIAVLKLGTVSPLNSSEKPSSIRTTVSTGDTPTAASDYVRGVDQKQRDRYGVRAWDLLYDILTGYPNDQYFYSPGPSTSL
jgi:hypothetical protein